MKRSTKILALIFLISIASFTALASFVFHTNTQNSQQQDSSFTCKKWKALGEYYIQSSLYRSAYDTLKAFLESCYQDTVLAQSVFTTLSDAVGGMLYQKDTAILEYREWLKRVLYLNKDTSYYCADVEAIAGTFGLPDVKSNGDAWLHVIKYLVDSIPCAGQNYYRKIIKDYLEYRYEHWKDTVKDSILTPYDSVKIYTLEELDLTILRGIASDVAIDHREVGSFIVSARENPFSSSLTVDYTIPAGKLLRCDILDVLGKPVYSEGLGWKDLGKHSFAINTNNWDYGIYYVRLSSGNNVVRTVKVIKSNQ